MEQEGTGSGGEGWGGPGEGSRSAWEEGRGAPRCRLALPQVLPAPVRPSVFKEPVCSIFPDFPTVYLPAYHRVTFLRFLS